MTHALLMLSFSRYVVFHLLKDADYTFFRNAKDRNSQ